MALSAKRTILDADNPLFREVHPVVLHIFCRGILAAESWRLILAPLVSFGVTLFTWPLILFGKVIHLGILFVVWWFLRDFISEFRGLDFTLLTVGVIVIFYKDIYDEVLFFLLRVLVIVTVGGFLRWVCAGYLSGTGFRQKFLTTEPMEHLTATMVNIIPEPFLKQYDDIMRLYLASNEAGNEDKLKVILESYSC